MSAFIMFILFLLNVVTIFAVILLFLRQNRLMEAERNQKETFAEIEELMSAFMMEIKEENDLLLKKLRQTKNLADKADVPGLGIQTAAKTVLASDHPANQEAATSIGIKGVNLSKKIAVSAYKIQQKHIEAEETPDYQPPGLTLEKDEVEISALYDPENQSGVSAGSEPRDQKAFKEALQASLTKEKPTLSEQITQLRGKGMTLEEIAKKLNRGKTEIDLLLKFRQ